MTAILPLPADLRAHLNLEADEIDEAFLRAQINHAGAYVLSFCPPIEGELPADLRGAILMLAAHLFENREAVLVGINAVPLPYGVEEAINAHRTWSF